MMALLLAPFAVLACWGWKLGTTIRRGRPAPFWSDEFDGLPSIGSV